MAIRFFTAGESHGPVLTAILDGYPAGVEISIEKINFELERRQIGYGSGPRMKLEKDQVLVLGGVLEGRSTGAPIAVQIKNLNHDRWRGKEVAPFTAPRPGHADLAAAVKYGYSDLRPGLERASARETAARVAVGALCKQFLEHFGVQVAGYVFSIGPVEADLDSIHLSDRAKLAELNDLRCPDQAAAEKMRTHIRWIIENRDTAGGIIEIICLGVPPGLGTHTQWDRRLEARIGAAVLSVQAIKGVEFGPAFANTHLTGTQVQDAIRLDGDHLIRSTNRSGGVEGGISTGQPIIIRAAMKPIATTLTPQPTVDLAEKKEVPTNYERSDFCPVPRAVPILESMVSFVLADTLIEKIGGDSITEMLPRWQELRQTNLSELAMDNKPHLFWPDE
jgi:chorismate synthase